MTYTLAPCLQRKKKKHGKQKGSTAHRYDRPADDAAMTRDAKKVIDEARKWLGTPYRYGGDSARGMDCSGLTCTAFEKAIGLKLPRNSREQAEFSRRIRRSELQPGDLVFLPAAAEATASTTWPYIWVTIQ